jgi:two-component system, OmpR family, KDP operon response regulator KdpE
VTRVLVVDDDPALLKALRIGLRARGDDVVVARSGQQAIDQVALAAPDLVILDLGLPDLDGVEVCRRIRTFSDVPIVVLSAYGDERRKVEALDTGADDFVTKPFGMAELEARLRVALRHHGAAEGAATVTTLRAGAIEVDLVHHMASYCGSPLQLTAKEFELLAYLVRHAGKVCTHHMILKDVWGPGYGAESNYVRVYTHRLRKKLGDDDAQVLKTIPGIGYQLVAASQDGTNE